MKRIVLIVTLMTAVLAGGPAFAEYPPSGGGLTVPSGSTITASTRSVVLQGSGYKPFSQVTLTFVLPTGLAGYGSVSLKTVTTDADGAFSTTVTIPASAPVGAATIVAAGVDPAGAPMSLTAAVTVTAVPTGATESLPRTGSDPTGLVRIALVLLGSGVVAAVVARRRFATK